MSTGKTQAKRTFIPNCPAIDGVGWEPDQCWLETPKQNARLFTIDQRLIQLTGSQTNVDFTTPTKRLLLQKMKKFESSNVPCPCPGGISPSLFELGGLGPKSGYLFRCSMFDPFLGPIIFKSELPRIIFSIVAQVANSVVPHDYEMPVH